MFTHQDIWEEPSWRKQIHQERILGIIATEFERYFADFIETEGGSLLSSASFDQLRTALGIKEQLNSKKNANKSREHFISLIKASIDDFEKNRDKYVDLLDPDFLEEEQEDLQAFKAKTLKNECPIIHNTLFNNRKELEKYKQSFSQASPKKLYDVVCKLSEFGREYITTYDAEAYEHWNSCEDLGLTLLETDESYTAYGVIGGGIRSHLLYKVYPHVFPNRSQNAIWALWYLSNKDDADCTMSSEFLMIDLSKNITQQNYFYPFDLFTFYAYNIYQMMKKKAEAIEVYIDPNYKYVIVDAFLNYVAEQHMEEINLLRSQIGNGGLGYD